jgi:transposase
LIYRARLFPNGESASSSNVWPDSRKGPGAGDRALFPPELIVAVKALACQLPSQLGLPFSKLTHDEIARQATKQGLVASISGKTIWRWLSKDAIRPWCYRSWIWPRDPDFEQKAGKVLDLYQGFWEDKPLSSDDFVISSDEKTSIQARKRLAPTTAPAPGRYGRIEHEYERKGALAYMAAWDVRRAKLFGLCKDSTGIDSFHELVDLVMSNEPYRSANRVFWVTDNGSSHRGRTSVERLRGWFPNAIQVHTPIHASWLNQIEIFFSVLQRKVLTPNDFESLEDLENRILSFQALYEEIAKPFEWKFTRKDLKNIPSEIDEKQKMAA